MFQLLPCSICQRTFSLRKEVPEDALLKCPNCGNQFRLGDVLDAFYSPWLVLSDPNQTVSAPTSALNTTDDSHRPVDSVGGVVGASMGGPTDSRLSFDNLLNTHEEASEALSLQSNALTDDVAEVAADNVFDQNELELPELTDQSPEAMATDIADDGLSLDVEEPLVSQNHQFESPMDATTSTTPLTSATSGTSGGVKKQRARRGDKGGLWSIIQVVLGGAAAIPVTLLLLWWVVGKDIMNAGPTVAQYAPWIVPKKFANPPDFITARRDGPRVPPPALGEGGFRNFDEELGANSAQAGTGTTSVTTANEPLDAGSNSASGEGTEMTEAFATIKSVKDKIQNWQPASPDKASNLAALFTELNGLSARLTAFPAEGGAMRLLKNDLKEVGRFASSESIRRDFNGLVLNQFKASAAPDQPGRMFLGIASEVSDADTQWIISQKFADYELKIEVPKTVLPKLEKGDKIFCMGSLIEETPSPRVIRISAGFVQIFGGP